MGDSLRRADRHVNEVSKIILHQGLGCPLEFVCHDGDTDSPPVQFCEQLRNPVKGLRRIPVVGRIVGLEVIVLDFQVFS